jgi:iron complex transport system ATP-binding protein
MDLRAERLALSYEDRTVIDGLDLVIPGGRVTVVVGANASGKSTLLRGMSRLLKPADGAVYLDGRTIHTMPTRQVARRLGLLPQSPVAPAGMTVMELVSRGRSPHQTWWRQWSAADEAAVTAALAATSMHEHAHRLVDELSGGQRQRAWIAMALAQQTDVLLLDEPTTHLDLAHQIEVLDLIVDLNRQEQRTIVMVLHDLNHACRYADHLVAMRSGRVIAEGHPTDIITAELVENLLALRCQIITDPVSGTPLVLPYGRHHAPVPVNRL